MNVKVRCSDAVTISPSNAFELGEESKKEILQFLDLQH